MIKLTNQNTKEVYINEDRIICVAPKQVKTGGTTIFMTNKIIEVTEGIETVMDEISKLQNNNNLHWDQTKETSR